MRKPVYSLFALVVSLFMLTACGTEAGNNLAALLGLGGGGAQFTKQFGDTAGDSMSLPITSAYDAKTQYLYTAQEISASGMITKIRLKQTEATHAEVKCRNMTIKMGHTNRTALTTTFASNVETGHGSEQTVLNNKTITIPKGTADTWIDIPLDTPFNYNGVDNLVVGFESATACSDGVKTNYIVSSDRFAYTIANDLIPGTAEYNTSTSLPVEDGLLMMQFVFAGGDNRVVVPNTSNAYVPFSDAYGNNRLRIQALYPKNIVYGSGGITAIGFHIGELTTVENSYTVTVRVGHTTLSSLSDTSQWDDNFNSGNPVTVAENAVFKVPAGVPVGAIVWLPLAKAFNYNGTDNLLMDVFVTSPSGLINITRATGTLGQNTTIWGMATDSDPQVDGADTNIYDVTFRFKGGTADVITAGAALDSYPYCDTTNNKMQYLYLSSELGTGGNLTGIALRLGETDSALSNYGSFTVKLGHTTSTTLGTTFSANMTDATSVYSGTFTVPAGLKRGDWITIPFSSSFNYDITKNLVVQMSALQGAGLNRISAETDAVRYSARHPWSGNNTTDISNAPSDWLADIRLIYE